MLVSVQRRMIYGVMLILVAITAYSILEADKVEPAFYSGTYEPIIWTDKEQYKLGEPVEAAIIFVNHNDHRLELAPIYSYSFGGNSFYEPNKIMMKVFVDYAIPRIIVPANGETMIINSTFTPTYPGPFTITGLGATKTVNVTGYKEVKFNSTGIRVEIRPIETVLKHRDNVEFNLYIVNDNPYPVKTPIFDGLRYGYSSDEIIGGVYYDWVYSHFKVEANSELKFWSHSFRVSYPKFTLYVYLDDYVTSLEMEVIP